MRTLTNAKREEVEKIVDKTIKGLSIYSQDWGYTESDTIDSLMFGAYIVGGNYDYIKNRFKSIVSTHMIAPILSQRLTSYADTTLYLDDTGVVYGVNAKNETQKVWVIQPSSTKMAELDQKPDEGILEGYVDQLNTILGLIHNHKLKPIYTSKQLVKKYLDSI